MRVYLNNFQLLQFGVSAGFITTTCDNNSPKETGNSVQELQQKPSQWPWRLHQGRAGQLVNAWVMS